MNSADCMLLTSSHEGSPNVVKEALSCNLPVISYDVGDVKQHLKHFENCFIIKDNDTKKMINKCKLVLNDGNRIFGGHEYIKKKISTKCMVNKIKKVYDDLNNN